MEEKNILRRNKMLQDFFSHFDIPVKITGNINNPVVVYQNKKVLSCYVNNFNLIFTDRPKNGVELFRHRLREKYNFTEQNIVLIKEWLNNTKHRECFTIRVKGTNLRLCGYNYLNKDNSNIKNRYPVFAEHEFKIYFQKEFALEIIEEYKNLNLEII